MIPKNKKIAILHPSITTVGGAVKMMIFLGNFLKEKGNDVCFYTLSQNKKNFENQINFQVKVLNKISISYEIRKSDYIFIGNSPMQFVGVFSKIFFFSKAKIIWWHHHYPWYYSENKGFNIFLKKYVEKFCLKSIDLLVSNSLYIKESLLKIYNIDSLILNPVVDKEFLINKNKKLNLAQKNLLSYSRWVKGKNLKQIFDTYEVLVNNFQNLKLFIGGEGDELKFYKTKYKGNKNIEFLGKLNKDSIISYLEVSNLFLFPSKIDSFGISALESICLGIPVVAFNEKGIIEVVKNGENGFLVSNENEFTQKSFEILNDEKLNLKLRIGCIKTRENFNYNRFEQQLEDIFLKLRG